MKKFEKDTVLLAAAFTLPILLIIVVVLSVYIPSQFVPTNYNFVYLTCEGSGNAYYGGNECRNFYTKVASVENNRLTETPVDSNLDLDNDDVPDWKEPYTMRLFLHDVKTNQSREISLEDAQQLKLDDSLTSPEGNHVSGEFQSGVNSFPFGSSSSYDYYLINGKFRKKLSLINAERVYYSYDDSFLFIGWIVP